MLTVAPSIFKQSGVATFIGMNMARPRVFISSTFYDLKHIRASLESFVNSLGFDPILFEKGDIAFHPDAPLDESCYREAASADIFVLIIGGRYGSPASRPASKGSDADVMSYESITQKEFESAQGKNVPTFILVDANVAAEYRTFVLNTDNSSIKYAHVDHINVFNLLRSIYERRQNNPVYNFDRATQIEGWLRDQWAGLFRDLLNSRSNQRQISDLNGQVEELRSINNTLKTYLEEIMRNIAPKLSERVIEQEHQKLEVAKRDAMLKNSRFGSFLAGRGGPDHVVPELFSKPTHADDAIKLVSDYLKQYFGPQHPSLLQVSTQAQNDFNIARVEAGLPEIDFSRSSFHDARLTAEKLKSELLEHNALVK